VEGQFRDLNAAVVRITTLSLGGRISVETVEEEVDRLTALWANPVAMSKEEAVLKGLDEEKISTLDLFDRAQLNHVLGVCQRSRSLSEAGRTLFSASRGRKTSANDADRLRKYLYRFGIEWAQIARPQESWQLR